MLPGLLLVDLSRGGGGAIHVILFDSMLLVKRVLDLVKTLVKGVDVEDTVLPEDTCSIVALNLALRQ